MDHNKACADLRKELDAISAEEVEGSTLSDSHDVSKNPEIVVDIHDDTSVAGVSSTTDVKDTPVHETVETSETKFHSSLEDHCNVSLALAEEITSFQKPKIAIGEEIGKVTPFVKEIKQDQFDVLESVDKKSSSPKSKQSGDSDLKSVYGSPSKDKVPDVTDQGYYFRKKFLDKLACMEGPDKASSHGREQTTSEAEIHIDDLNLPGPSTALTKAEWPKDSPKADCKHKSPLGERELLDFRERKLEEEQTKTTTEEFSNDPNVTCRDVIGKEESFENISFELLMTPEEVIGLMKTIKVKHYSANGSEDDQKIYSYCKFLWEKDYCIKVIDNTRGELSRNYPTRIIIPYEERLGDTYYRFDIAVCKELIENSQGARCRDRFVIPAIFWNGKFICRGGTLGVRKSKVYETVIKPESPKRGKKVTSPMKRIIGGLGSATESIMHRTASVAQAVAQLIDPTVMKTMRDEERKLLTYYDIDSICDLMVEKRKKKYWIYVSSSEKIYKDDYPEIEILQMPYPGCEFFKKYHAKNREPENLFFNWNRREVDAELDFPENRFIRIPDQEWEKYKEWDIVVLTQNYMEVILTYIVQGNASILVHCISGWDRTPLFIALIRISMWADGLIHKTLNVLEMAYLTLGYDWYLFGHNLPQRVDANEEILHFCYNFLHYIADDRFSIARMWNELRRQGAANVDENLDLPFTPGKRAEKILELREFVLRLYDEIVLGRH